MLEGTVIEGRYELLTKLRSGGQGFVFKAKALEQDSFVAVKIFRSTSLADKARERMKREIQILQRTKHPNIVKYLDSGTFDEHYGYLVLEWLEGQTLDVLIKTRLFTLAEVLVIGRQLASALEQTHEAGIIHRDIKPANIILEKRQEQLSAKLFDFGIAKSLDNMAALTVTGAVLGTPCYMAPEQARKATQVDATADIFSLGVVLYEMLVQALPWESADDLLRLSRLMSEVARPITEFAPQLPSEMVNFLSRSLDINTKLRPQSVRTVRHCLDQIHHRVSSTQLARTYASHKAETSDSTSDEVTKMVPRTKLANKSRALSQTSLAPLERSEIRFVSDPTFEGTLFELGVSDWSEVLSSVESELPTDYQVEERKSPAPMVSSSERSKSLANDSEAMPRRRGRILEEVRENIFRATSRQQPDFTIIEAAAGVGKSFLLQQIRSRLRDNRMPARVWIVRTEEWAQVQPYWVFRVLLRRLCALEGNETITQVHERITRLWPEERMGIKEELLSPAPTNSTDSRLEVTEVAFAAAPNESDIVRTKTCGVLARFIWGELQSSSEAGVSGLSQLAALPQALETFMGAFAQTCGLVLLIDDFHFVDQASLQLLTRLLNREGPNALVGVGFTQAGLDLSDGLNLLPKSNYYELSPLSDSEARLILEHDLEDVNALIFERMVNQAAGNALFLGELVRHFQTHKENWAEPVNSIPATVGEAARIRLKALAPLASDVICAAAVTGEVFWAEGISSCLKASKKRLFLALKDLVEKGFIVPMEKSSLPGCHQFRFCHSLYRSVALAWHSKSDRQFLHDRIAKFLRKTSGTDRLLLAMHLSKAGKNEKAALLFARSANEALRIGALDFASQLVERGWAELPEVEPSEVAYLALSNIESKLDDRLKQA